MSSVTCLVLPVTWCVFCVMMAVEYVYHEKKIMLLLCRLNYCDIKEKNYSALAAVLSSNTILKEMDLSNSRLCDSGVKQLCVKLKKSKLQILK